ncbi:hypothetical protein G6F54_013939 [Rhizopus delemar]|nr:hypothetical protein G6F54_013939 [Rhizopus delemar]
MQGGSAKDTRRRAQATLIAALLGFFVITLDAVVVNVALPTLAHDLGASVDGLQWVVDGYTLMFGALLLYAALTTLLPSLVFRTPFDVDPVEQEPAGEGESAPVAATETLPEAQPAPR